MDYYAKREENKAKAHAHTEYVAKKYGERIADAIENSVIYGVQAKEPDKIKKEEREKLPEPEVIFLNTDSVSALFDRGRGKTAILNYASFKNPGGKFYDGSFAQEEALCHQSFLYNVLREFQGYYAWNNVHKNRALYENRAIFSPGVVFTKADKALLADVITCAAPNFSAASRWQGVKKEENSIILKKRILFVRDIAETEGVQTLITGAYGCGVFGQNPEEVALLQKAAFAYTTIKRIIYAVPGNDKNARVFRDVF